jgi:Nif-specific regulatory protein
MHSALNPRLVGIAGPVEGGIFGLSDGDLSIGGDPSNQLVIDDPSIAARQCAIRRRPGDEFEIQDLGSDGVTMVNGLPVTERTLMHGDQIRLGECRFIFWRWDGEPESDSGPVCAQPCVLPQRKNCSYQIGAASPDGLTAESQARCSLTLLLRAGAGIQTVRSAEEIAQQLLEAIFEAIPAQQGGILLFDGQSQEPSFVSYRDRETGPASTVRMYNAIVDRARREVTGILATGILPDRSPAAGDRTEPEPRSVLAAPIVALARTLGVMFLDSCVPSMPFHEDHLELAGSVGAIMGLALENARRTEWLEKENRRLQEAAGLNHEMVGGSPRMREVYRFVSKVAPTDSTVLICGESGTGKELVARAIHHNSQRATMPFLAVNCAAMSETLLESDLFGHEKGAFTGAYAQKRGKLELADRGTVFLDEVGEMPPACQARLLRVIQEREFERVGGTRAIRTDIRLIAATNRDLKGAIEAGTFRTDLYHRLNVVSLTMPPLRDRREDIPLLSSYFAARHGKKAGRRVTGIARETLACLQAYDWPGNVRELENAIERAVVLGSTELILAEDLPEAVLESSPAGTRPIGAYHETIRNQKMRAIVEALDQAGGSFTEAAKLLGIHPNYLHRLVRNLNLRGAISNSAGG